MRELNMKLYAKAAALSILTASFIAGAAMEATLACAQEKSANAQQTPEPKTKTPEPKTKTPEGAGGDGAGAGDGDGAGGGGKKPVISRSTGRTLSTTKLYENPLAGFGMSAGLAFDFANTPLSAKIFGGFNESKFHGVGAYYGLPNGLKTGFVFLYANGKSNHAFNAETNVKLSEKMPVFLEPVTQNL